MNSTSYLTDAARLEKSESPTVKPQLRPPQPPTSRPFTTESTSDVGADILQALNGRITQVPLTFGYRLGLAVAACALVLLPILYLTLIASAGWGMWHYATEIIPSLLQKRRSDLFLFVPLVIGGIFMVFLVKPFFAPPQRAVKPLRLDRRQEPLLFTVVERLSELLGTPKPIHIYLSNDVNASAALVGKGEERGLELTLGAPLVSGLTLPQLIGVIGHELGHFNQATGMRLSSFVRRTNAWLARIAYERDSFDHWLTGQARETENLLWTLILWICKGLIFLVRKLLILMAWSGHAISSFQMRQMEYDADRYEVRLVGYETFAKTTEALQILGLAYQQSLAGLEECWNDGRLPRDLFALTVRQSEALDEKILAQIREHIATAKTGVFASHPSDKDRLASAAREAQKHQPMFHSSQPASVLLRHFDRLSVLVTRAYYGSVLGEAVREENLISVDQTANQLEQSSNERVALARFFQAQLSSLRPLQLSGSIDAPKDRAELEGLRVRVLQLRESRESAHQRLVKSFHALASTQQACALLELSLPFQAQELGLPKRDLAGMRRLEGRAMSNFGAVSEELAPLDREDATRLSKVLGLLTVPEVAEKADPDQALRAEIPLLMETLTLLGALFPTCRLLTLERAVLGILASKLEDFPDHGDLHQRIQLSMRQITDLVAHLASAFGEAPYPFSHQNASMTLARYIIAAVDSDHLIEVFAGSEQTQSRFYEVYFRVVARLAFVAEHLETTIGLEPLPEPEIEEET